MSDPAVLLLPDRNAFLRWKIEFVAGLDVESGVPRVRIAHDAIDGADSTGLTIDLGGRT